MNELNQIELSTLNHCVNHWKEIIEEMLADSTSFRYTTKEELQSELNILKSIKAKINKGGASNERKTS